MIGSQQHPPGNGRDADRAALAEEFQACRLRLTAALGEEAFARFEAEGEALSPERALTLTLTLTGIAR
ncbi:MAG TPA: hypothetical protein VEG38_00535 [Acidimicrobiia bacterium]|nr:hypothetical protein [Acidimicrobiia bacterium]